MIQSKDVPAFGGITTEARITSENAGERWWDLVLIGGILALQFTLAQFSRRTFVALNLVLFGVLWAFSQSQRRRFGNTGPRMLLPLRGGLALVAINLVIITWQRNGVEGPMVAALTTIHELCIVGSLLTVYLFAKDRPLGRCLAIFSSMTLLFGFANLIAERLGLGITNLTDRMEVFESRMNEGFFRWQSPLLSSWQLSGLLRVTFPLAIYFALLYWRGRQKAAAAVWVVLAGIGMLVLWRVEFRAAAIPSLFLGLCLAIPSCGWRRRMFVAAIVYPLLSPFLFTSSAFESMLLNSLPDFVPSVLGQRLQEVVTLSSRAEIWRQGIENLVNGSHFYVGEGHYLLDCTANIDVEGHQTSELFRRISFHQAVLDQFYIYGTLPTIAILTTLYWSIRSAVRRIHWSDTQRISNNEEVIAIMSLALIAIANAHDGFFIEGTYMYLLVAIAVNSLWLSVTDGRSATKVTVRPSLR
jgi:hypothetical protein